MRVIAQKIPEVLLIQPRVFTDERGYFVESFQQQAFCRAIGQEIRFIQDNESQSSQGVLRGLHYQTPPFAQAKLVRVIVGTILDVAVDLRASSPTFGQHVALELDAASAQQLFIPRGFAHGFVVLSKSAIVAYKVDNNYAPECEAGLKFDDDGLNIDWRLPTSSLKLSDKDKKLPALAQIAPPF